MPFEDPQSSRKSRESDHVSAPIKLRHQQSISNAVHQVSQKIHSTWIGKLMSRLSITKKFGFSYALAIGIPVIGTTVGLALAEYYERQALQKLTLADEQKQLVTNLEKAVIGMRSHPQQLLPILGKSILLYYESYEFAENVAQVRLQFSSLGDFIEKSPSYSAVDTTQFKQLLQAYEETTELYLGQLNSLLTQIDAPNLKPAEIPAAQQQLLDFIGGEATTKLNDEFKLLSENLNQIIEAAQTQKTQATDTLKKVQALRLQIISASMLLSVAVAMLLALYMGREIASPLTEVTSIARRVTQESNFDLRVPVTTEDEIALLATSLNQLIQWVGEYTDELELARQMLEQRVEARTLELTQALQELKQTQSQLIQSEKMSSLGQLVAGVAHEINNPVNFIFGNLKYARDYTKELLELVELYQQHYPNSAAEIQERMEEIEIDFLATDLPKIMSSMQLGVDRIRNIVLSLRSFSRVDEAQMKAVDIHEGINSTLLILNNRLKRSIEVIKQYGSLPLIECYPAQINQVFMNILANAIDALEESVAYNKQPQENVNRQLKKLQIVIKTALVDKNQIRVSIRDNGSGISPQIKDKVFEPFFTTKNEGKGTGLGLSISYEIIDKHCGKIEVISEPGEGTEFVIYLPIRSKLLVTG
ncbi:MAG: HAMP domain-containing protein [Symploca sp. SIO2E9]|nr:HAMP domain-containing protein [Symploca sp. SIO2E9]